MTCTDKVLEAVLRLDTARFGDVGIHDPPAWYFVHRGSTLDVIPSHRVQTVITMWSMSKRSPAGSTRAKDPSSFFQQFSELVSMSWLYVTLCSMSIS